MKFAAIDIGSNAIRLLLARVLEEGDEPLLKKEVLVRMPIRLGEEVFRTGAISEEMTHRLVDTLHGFKHLITAYPAMDYAAFATSALREAKNGRTVVTRVRRACGIPIEVIQGRREAEVICANHVEQRLDLRKTYLYIDVGGGSTEVTLIAEGRMVSSASFPIGTVRMLQGGVPPKTIESLKTWVRRHREEYGKMTAIGSGGNINTLYRMARIARDMPMTIEELRDLRDVLASYSLEERIVTLGLRPDRADVIVFASDIFLSVMRWGRMAKMYVPQVGLADGIVHLLYAKHRRRVRTRSRSRQRPRTRARKRTTARPKARARA